MCLQCTQRTWHFLHKPCAIPAQVAQLWAASMADQTILQQQGGGRSMQQQGGQTAQLAGSKTGRHEPAAGAADEASKSPNTRGQKKVKGHNSSHQCHNSSADQGSARACSDRSSDGYQCAAGSIFQRTASAEPDLPSADCDPVPSLVESSARVTSTKMKTRKNNVNSLFHVLSHVCFNSARFLL